jgi:hypothetical protein
MQKYINRNAADFKDQEFILKSLINKTVRF